jgi:hypothetical protein
MKPFAVHWEEYEENGEPERVALYDHQLDEHGVRNYTTGIVSIAAETCTSRGHAAMPIDGKCETVELTEHQAQWLLIELQKLLQRRKQAERRAGTREVVRKAGAR